MTGSAREERLPGDGPAYDRRASSPSRVSVSLVGSTGSIGTQAVEVIEQCPEAFEVVALGALRSVDTLASQAERLAPRVVAIGEEALAPELARRLPSGVELVAGTEGFAAIATDGGGGRERGGRVRGPPGDIGRTRGRPSTGPGQQGIPDRRRAGGPAARRTPGAEIVPVDSEHCALHQCLRAGTADEVRRLVLTASGGPFRGRRREELASIAVGEALAHPTWSMGPKITVDSSTLMNKGLEVIEAHELFGIPYDAIDVVVHPQSIVHSMVEYVDGAVIAQLSLPDMRLPIGYALSYPSRLPVEFGAIDWTRCATLEFEEPDHALFPCLGIAYQAGRSGDLVPAWLNAANEVAVGAFLKQRIRWTDIADVVARTLDQYAAPAPASSAGAELVRSVEDVLEADATARREAEQVVVGLEAAA